MFMRTYVMPKQARDGSTPKKLSDRLIEETPPPPTPDAMVAARRGVRPIASRALHVEATDPRLARRGRTTSAAHAILIAISRKTIITRNDSPDVGFETSINPYRGCEHGCIYCYARPTHEYLGFSAGLDFESKIMVKTDAPELLEAELSSPRWKPQVHRNERRDRSVSTGRAEVADHATLSARCWRSFAIRLQSSRRIDW